MLKYSLSLRIKMKEINSRVVAVKQIIPFSTLSDCGNACLRFSVHLRYSNKQKPNNIGRFTFYFAPIVSIQPTHFLLPINQISIGIRLLILIIMHWGSLQMDSKYYLDREVVHIYHWISYKILAYFISPTQKHFQDINSPMYTEQHAFEINRCRIIFHQRNQVLPFIN